MYKLCTFAEYIKLLAEARSKANHFRWLDSLNDTFEASREM